MFAVRLEDWRQGTAKENCKGQKKEDQGECRTQENKVI